MYYSLLFKELPYLLAGCTVYGTIFCTCQIFCTDPDLYQSTGFESYLQIAVIETIVAIFLILSSDHMNNFSLVLLTVKFMYLRISKQLTTLAFLPKFITKFLF